MKKLKDNIALILTAVWGLLAALNEAGVFDLMPFDEETNKWVKWVVAVVVVIINARSYRKPTSVVEIENVEIKEE